MSNHGVVVSVTSEVAGDTLAEAASLGATTLVLEDVSPFDEDGGQAELGVGGTTTEVVTYLSVDPDTDTMTLAVGLGSAFAAETVVSVYPETRSRIAAVRLDDDDDAPIEARVPFSMIPLLPQGIREASYESVIVDVLRGQWVIVDVLGEQPEIVGAAAPGSDDTAAPPVPENVRTVRDLNAVICNWADPLDEGDADLLDAGVKGYQVEVVENGTPDFSLISETNGKRWLLRTASHARFATTHYKRRYWFRVRTVDFHGNKSDWVVVGPVRPSPTRLVRRVEDGEVNPSLIDLRNAFGTPLASGGQNQAYLTAATTRGVAAIDGSDADGVLTARLTTGSVADRIYAGVAFRITNADNYLFAAVVDRSGQNALVLGRCNAGVLSDLAVDTGVTIETETTFEISVELDGSLIGVFLDGEQLISTTSSVGLANVLHGLYCDRDVADDNGQSRWHSFIFAAASDDDDEPIVDDDFDRDAGTTLGIAESGQTWSALRGTWGIEEVDVPFALFGAALVMPVFYTEIVDLVDGFAWPPGPTGAKVFGRGGEDVEPLALLIDQPTRFILNASASVGNRSTITDYNLRMFIAVDVDGVRELGRPSSEHLGTDADPVTKWHSISTQREFFVDATPDSPKLVEFWWGFRNSSGLARAGSIREAKMTCWATFAPDWSSVFSAAQRASWTRFGLNRQAYRRFEADDVGE